MSAFYTAVARFYDAENADKTDDLRLYTQMAAQFPGEILDVGCGTGRVMVHLARKGHRVSGIESDGAMLDRLEGKLELLPQLREHISIVLDNVLTYEYERRFSLILLSYNALMHFHRQTEQIALLQRLRQCLLEAGRLLIDLPNPGPVFASPDTDALTLERTFLEPETGHMVMLQSISYLDRSTQMLQLEWVYDVIDGDGSVKRLIVPHLLRYFFLPELKLLLERCGFLLDAAYGDSDCSAFVADCPRLIALAKCD